MDHHDLTVSNLMGNSVGAKRFCHFPIWCHVLDCIDSWSLLSSLLLTLKAPRKKCILKMSSAEVVCCK